MDRVKTSVMLASIRCQISAIRSQNEKFTNAQCIIKTLYYSYLDFYFLTSTFVFDLKRIYSICPYIKRMFCFGYTQIIYLSFRKIVLDKFRLYHLLTTVRGQLTTKKGVRFQVSGVRFQVWGTSSTFNSEYRHY